MRTQCFFYLIEVFFLFNLVSIFCNSSIRIVGDEFPVIGWYIIFDNYAVLQFLIATKNPAILVRCNTHHIFCAKSVPTLFVPTECPIYTQDM